MEAPDPMDIPPSTPESSPRLIAMNADTGELIDPSDLPVDLLPALMGTRCTAHSKQSGSRCKLQAIPGGFVCRFHGGGAPQTIAKAASRLEDARDLALARLTERIDQDGDIIDPAVLLNVVVKLTEKAELMQGRATSRSEDVQIKRTEQIKADLLIRLDAVNAGGSPPIDVREVAP